MQGTNTDYITSLVKSFLRISVVSGTFIATFLVSVISLKQSKIISFLIS